MAVTDGDYQQACRVYIHWQLRGYLDTVIRVVLLILALEVSGTHRPQLPIEMPLDDQRLKIIRVRKLKRTTKLNQKRGIKKAADEDHLR